MSALLVVDTEINNTEAYEEYKKLASYGLLPTHIAEF